MGCCGDDEVVPKESPENDQASPNSDEIFVKRRSNTDLPALCIMIILIGGFGYLMSTAVKKGDIFRILYGYDDCGNVCGRINTPETDPQYSCKGRDMRKFPYLLMNMGPNGVKSRECVSNCSASPDQVLFLNRCMPKQATDTANSVIRKIGLDSFFREASSDLSNSYKELIYLLLIALAISVAILIAFRFMVQWIIYIVMSGSIIACIGGTTYLWLLWYHEKKAVDAKQIYDEDSSKLPYLIYAICMSTVTVVALLIVLVMRKRIALVVQLFKEAGKAVAFMPCVLFQPVYTYLLLGLTVVGWVFCMLYIESAGDIYKNTKQHVHYKKDAVLIATRWYNLFMFFVTCEFFLGCQHMVIAGSVSRWFFTREKKRLSIVIPGSFCYLVKYHLGTVCFGALVIGLIRLIRAILSFIQNHLKKYENGCIKGILWCCQCCLWCFECALKFLTRNAYIETSIYGCNFCTGGKKAFQALSSNILRVVAINSVGDFVLFLGKVLVVALNVVAGVYMMQKKENLHHPWVPIGLAAVFAFLVAHCFISVYEMIIDTIFICFCEDCVKNDGINRPYFMSRGLMEFVENSKKALRELKGRTST